MPSSRRGRSRTSEPIPACMGKAIVDHLPLVRRMVRKLSRHLPANVQRDDLLSAGVFGLVDSLRKNGGDGGATFEWYARTRIRGAIFDELRAQDWLSRRARDRASAEQESDASPTTSFVSLDEVTANDDQCELAANDDPSALAEAISERQALVRAIEMLPERERTIVGKHYFEGVKFKDIGIELGVSEPRISQLHSRALTLLRAMLDKAA
jgi:RNA polymerase sigma factor for flagellar operon FliA